MTMQEGVLFERQDISSDRVIAELFYEQEHPLISGAYKHGFIRTVYTLSRSLLPRIGQSVPSLPAFYPGETVAIAFFENEYQAVLKNQAAAKIDRIIRLQLQHLPVVLQALGWRGTVRESAYFVRKAIRRQGIGALRTLGVPALGWLLYKALCQQWRGVQQMRVATMNMQHPLSVGVAHAARVCGHRTLYVEHASTTLAVFTDRGYELLAVELPHTRALLESAGVARSRILLLREGPDLVATPIERPIRTMGLCVNDLDSMDAVRRVIKTLRGLGIHVTLRVHDSDRRIEAFRNLAKEFELLFSSARESRIEAFLATVDLLIAGNSNVLADALRAGRPAIHYWDGAEDTFDYYGLVAHYRLAFARNTAQLAELVAPFCALPASTP
jgi:hypothetical protein